MHCKWTLDRYSRCHCSVSMPNNRQWIVCDQKTVVVIIEDGHGGANLRKPNSSLSSFSTSTVSNSIPSEIPSPTALLVNPQDQAILCVDTETEGQPVSLEKLILNPSCNIQVIHKEKTVAVRYFDSLHAWPMKFQLRFMETQDVIQFMQLMSRFVSCPSFKSDDGNTCIKSKEVGLTETECISASSQLASQVTLSYPLIPSEVSSFISPQVPQGSPFVPINQTSKKSLLQEIKHNPVLQSIYSEKALFFDQSTQTDPCVTPHVTRGCSVACQTETNAMMPFKQRENEEEHKISETARVNEEENHKSSENARVNEGKGRIQSWSDHELACYVIQTINSRDFHDLFEKIESIMSCDHDVMSCDSP